MVEIRMFLLADAAYATPGQKFSVLGGGVDQVIMEHLPAPLPHLAALLALEIEAGADIKCDYQLSLRAPDGVEVWHINGQIARTGSDPRASVVWQSLELPPMVIAAPGPFTLEAVCGDSRRSLTLTIQGPPKTSGIKPN
jgi:hypothetical protein